MRQTPFRDPTIMANWSELNDREPAYALVVRVDLVVIRYDDEALKRFAARVENGSVVVDEAEVAAWALDDP